MDTKAPTFTIGGSRVVLDARGARRTVNMIWTNLISCLTMRMWEAGQTRKTGGTLDASSDIGESGSDLLQFMSYRIWFQGVDDGMVATTLVYPDTVEEPRDWSESEVRRIVYNHAYSQQSASRRVPFLSSRESGLSSLQACSSLVLNLQRWGVSQRIFRWTGINIDSGC